jgi:hypothetical protein
MTRETKHGDEMRSHYDFSDGERGKYAARYTEGTNVVVLDPDVAEGCPDPAAVNDALRTFTRVSAAAVRGQIVLKKRRD